MALGDFTNPTWANGASPALSAGNMQAITDKVEELDTEAAANAPKVTALEAGATPVGSIIPYGGITAPTGFLFCHGTAVSRTTYSTLYGVLTASKGTVTISIASPGVVTLSTHGLATGDCIELTTTGALPTGLTVNTNYYVVYVDANTFSLATSLANALAGTKINTSGSQSGTHTLRHCPFGISGATNFLLPDMRESSVYGAGTRGSGVTAHDAAVLGQFKDDQFQGHIHYQYQTDAAGVTTAAGWPAIYNYGSSSASNHTPKSDGTNGTPRTGTVTRGKIIGVNYIIRAV